MKKALLTLFYTCFISVIFAQNQTFDSEYNKLTWPIKLGYGGGLTGDDGNYKRLTLFHGHSIALQTGSNDRNHSNTRLYINGSGYVGIGTTSPSSKFDLTGNSGEKNKIHISNASVGSDGGYFDINMGTSNSYAAGLKAYVPSGQPGIDRVYLGLYTTTHNGTTVTSRVERMTVTDKGNVGIGITQPSERLTINGNVKFNSEYNKILFPENLGFAGGITGDDGQYKRLTLFHGHSIALQTGSNNKSHSNTRLYINSSGDIGIGTTDPQSKLAVNGQIRATEVKVLANISVPDYVFEPDYKLRTLKETKEYITENKHLPEIPSASEIGENGIDIGDMNMRLLKKIEELTLYQIELLERLEKLETENNRIDELEKRIEQLKKN